MAGLVFAMNQSLDGYVELEFARDRSHDVRVEFATVQGSHRT
jgi:hypothetical protein